MASINVETILTTKFAELSKVLQSEPFPPVGVNLTYGTAGFRTKFELLDSTFLRMGMLASIRSMISHNGASVGLMVTASHNPEKDNGIKMVDYDGGMLAQSWEGYAYSLANAPPDKALSVLASIIEAESSGSDISATLNQVQGSVYIGLDTRAHSPKLAALAVQGAQLMGAKVIEVGAVTTPQLHHIVRMYNIGNGVIFTDEVETGVDKIKAKEWASVQGYYEMLSAAYLKLINSPVSDVGTEVKGERRIIVDASCGVGGMKLIDLYSKVNAKVQTSKNNETSDERNEEADASRKKMKGSDVEGLLNITILNNVGEGYLNEACGAEYVQKGRTPPHGWDVGNIENMVNLCSFDGDGDRLVFHFFDEKGEWHLLDGDKCAVLLAEFISEELSHIPSLSVNMAMVQTAYANGASTEYAKNKNIELDFAKTGVKYVHHTAAKYDIGVYFEANGHGTALIRGHVIEQLKTLLKGQQSEKRAVIAIERILALHQLINQAVGDSMSDMLAIEAVLHLKGWTIETWKNCYTDLPSRQCKLPVRDRSVIQCSDDETYVIEPSALQAKLNSLLASKSQEAGGGGQYRCFVRPSGTEDVVRVYAEAPTVFEADLLAYETSLVVYEMAGGVGEPPVNTAVR